MTNTRDLLGGAIERLSAAPADAGVETPRLDAELLLAAAVGVDRTAVVAHPDAPVGADAERTFLDWVERRAGGEPVAYLRGIREFHGIALTVDPRALIPRPETEAIVDLGLAEIMAGLTGQPSSAGVGVRVLDVGTGSGAIAIALAVALRGRRVPPEDVALTAVDISADALDLARENAVGHGVGDRVRFIEADLVPAGGSEPWDVILANLPYVATDALMRAPAPTSFEPVLALDGGPDGLVVIDRLLDRLPDVLAPGGVAMLEIGADQGEAIARHVAARLPDWGCRVEPDLAGLPRVAIVARASR